MSRQYATLTEVDTSWCYDDIARANGVMDMMDALELAATKKPKGS